MCWNITLRPVSGESYEQLIHSIWKCEDQWVILLRVLHPLFAMGAGFLVGVGSFSAVALDSFRSNTAMGKLISYLFPVSPKGFVGVMQESPANSCSLGGLLQANFDKLAPEPRIAHVCSHLEHLWCTEFGPDLQLSHSTVLHIHVPVRRSWNWPWCKHLPQGKYWLKPCVLTCVGFCMFLVMVAVPG